MGTLTTNKKTLEKYFGILKNLDVDSKRNLISELNKSIQSKKKTGIDIDKLYGSWNDSRTADEIIEEIENARFNERNIQEF